VLEFVGIVVTWPLAKQSCRSLRKSIMLLDFYFIRLDQIGHMYLNDLRRQVTTHDKTQTVTRMGEPSIALDP